MRSLLRAVFWSVAIAVVVIGTFTVVGVVLTQGWADAVECEPPTRCQQEPFDSLKWKTYGNWSDPVRLRMVDDLSASYGLRGQPREWIDEQLGTPETSHPFETECDYVYWLGPARSLVSTDFEWLCLGFEDEVVIDAQILTG